MNARPVVRILVSLPIFVVALSIVAAETRGGDRSSARATAAKLAKVRMTLDWEAMELGAAIDAVGTSTDIAFVVSPALRERDTDAPTVSLELSKVRVSKLLEILGDVFEIEYVQQDGYVLVTTPQDAVRRTAVLRVYDVSALLYRAPDFTGPEIVLRGSDDDDGLPAIGTEERDEPPHVDEIVDLVQRTTAGKGDWDFDGVSIDSFGTRKIVVRHTPRKHLEIARTLALLGAF